MDRKAKLGFLGVGWIGQNRMEAIINSGCAEAAAICDPSPENAKAAKASASEAEITETFDQLLDKQLDAIVIATPSALHADQAIKALGKNLPVFCQKPLGRNAAEVTEIIKTAQKNDLLLGVDFSYRYTEAVKQISKIITSGQIGQVYTVDLVFHNAYGPDKQWFYDPILSGGGCVIDLGIHLVDLAMWIFNFPKVTQVSSRLFTKGQILNGQRTTAVEDYASARFDLENGPTVNLSCSWGLNAGCDAVIEASFYGTEGAVSLKNINGSFYDFAAEKFTGTKKELLCQPPDNWSGRAAVDWAKKLVRSPKFDPDIENTIKCSQVIDQIYNR